MTPLLQQGRGTLHQAERTLTGLTDAFGPNALLINNFYTTLEEVRGAPREMRILTEMLQTQEETLLRGKQVASR